MAVVQQENDAREQEIDAQEQEIDVQEQDKQVAPVREFKTRHNSRGQKMTNQELRKKGAHGPNRVRVYNNANETGECGFAHEGQKVCEHALDHGCTHGGCGFADTKVKCGFGDKCRGMPDAFKNSKRREWVQKKDKDGAGDVIDRRTMAVAGPANADIDHVIAEAEKAAKAFQAGYMAALQAQAQAQAKTE